MLCIECAEHLVVVCSLSNRVYDDDRSLLNTHHNVEPYTFKSLADLERTRTFYDAGNLLRGAIEVFFTAAICTAREMKLNFSMLNSSQVYQGNEIGKCS